MIYCFRLGSVTELLWYPLMIIDLRLIDLYLKKILHKYVYGQSQWSISSRSRNVSGCRGGRPFKWGFHAVSEWTDTTGWGGEGMSSLGGRIIHIGQILTHTHTHNTLRANAMSRSQWSIGNGHFFWHSLLFAAIELAGIMVKFYSIYQICSPFSGWCIITTCVSSSVLWFS